MGELNCLKCGILKKGSRGNVCHACYNKAYYQTHKTELLAYGQNYRRVTNHAHDKTPQRRLKGKIRSASRYALIGKARPPCQKCNSKVNIQLHHPDYSKPDEIIPLCNYCHINLHVELRKLEVAQ